MYCYVFGPYPSDSPTTYDAALQGCQEFATCFHKCVPQTYSLCNTFRRFHRHLQFYQLQADVKCQSDSTFKQTYFDKEQVFLRADARERPGEQNLPTVGNVYTIDNRRGRAPYLNYNHCTTNTCGGKRRSPRENGFVLRKKYPKKTPNNPFGSDGERFTEFSPIYTFRVLISRIVSNCRTSR